MTIRLLKIVLCCFVVTPMIASAQESKEVEAIHKCYNDYLQSKNWEGRRELMTEDAWVHSTMANLYAYRKVTETEVINFGLQDYRLPDMPDDYKVLPEKSAIDNARKIAKSAYMDLSSKLGSKFLSLAERVCDVASKGKPKPQATLQDTKILDDQSTATAEVRVDGNPILLPVNFKKVNGQWRFDGKNELLYFDRLR